VTIRFGFQLDSGQTQVVLVGSLVLGRGWSGCLNRWMRAGLDWVSDLAAGIRFATTVVMISLRSLAYGLAGV
jgi:hypothetical protein